MKTIDLHVHSNFSDGSETTARLVELAIEAGLSAFALTDHDTTKGYSSLFEATSKYNAGLPKDEQLEVLPGVEISAAYKDSDIHILGLLVDPFDNNFNAFLKVAENERTIRNLKMLEKLNSVGLNISYEKIVANAQNSVITRAHFGKFLVENGVVEDIPTAFKKYLGNDTPFYVARNFTPPEEAINAILKAEGIPVLAHPLSYKLPISELESLVDRLIGYGLRGIETFYSNHTKEDETYVKALSLRKGLIQTGGSDFHGKPKPSIKIGVGKGNLKIPYSILENLKSEKRRLN